MSDEFYPQRLRWSSDRGGIAKTPTKQVRLDPGAPPRQLQVIPDIEFIDYIPAIHLYRVRTKFYGERDMEDHEIGAAREALRSLTEGV